MATYPSDVWDKNPQDESNDGAPDPTRGQARDYNLAAEEIAAIQNELGHGAVAINTPKGVMASLAERLAVSLNADGTLVTSQIKLIAPMDIYVGDNGKYINDVGATGIPSTRIGTLPEATGSLISYKLITVDQGIQIASSAGARIRLEGNLSQINGYIKSTDPGANLTIIDIDVDLWVCFNRQGEWITLID